MAFFDHVWYVNSGLMPIEYFGVNQASGATLAQGSGLFTCPPGSLILVAVHEAGATTDGSVSDGGTNTYALVQGVTLGSGAGRLQVFRAYNSVTTSPLTITYTKVLSAHAAAIRVIVIPNALATSDPVDSAVTATQTGTTAASITATSGTPSVAGECIIGFFGMNSTGTTLTEPTGYRAEYTNITGQSTAQVGFGWLGKDDTSTTTFAPSISGTVTGTAAIIIGVKPKYTGGYFSIPYWRSGIAKTAGALIRQFSVPTEGSERIFVCTVAGTTNATEPAWSTTHGAKTTDNTATWLECMAGPGINGDLTNCPTWTTVKGLAVSQGQIIQNVAGTYLFACTTTGTAGSGSEPAWTLTAGVTKADNTITWTCLGPVGNFPAWSAPSPRVYNVTNSYSLMVAGDTVYLSDTHAEVGIGSTVGTIGTPATSTAAPCNYILSVDHTVSLPPNTAAALKKGAQMMTAYDTLGNAISYEANAGVRISYTYGVVFRTYGASFSILGIGGGSGGGYLKFEQCTFSAEYGTSGYNRVIIGANANEVYELVDCTMNFGTTSGYVGLSGGEVIWRNPSSVAAFTGQISATCFLPGGSGIGVSALFEGLDLSGVASTTIFNLNTSAPSYVALKDCRLPTTANLLLGEAIGTSNSIGVMLDVINCDSGNKNYRNERHTGNGDLLTQNTIYRVGGLAIESVAVSHSIVGNANASWTCPFLGLPMTTRNSVVATNRTVTVYGIVNAAAVPNNDQFWFDTEYLGSASYPVGSYNVGTKAKLYTAATGLSADSTSDWTGGVTARANTTAYTLAQRIKLASNTGRVFFCTTAGTSSGSEPVGYATAVDGGAVTDGTAVFRAGCRFSMAVTLSTPQPNMTGLLTVYPKVAYTSPIFLDPLPILS